MARRPEAKRARRPADRVIVLAIFLLLGRSLRRLFPFGGAFPEGPLYKSASSRDTRRPRRRPALGCTYDSVTYTWSLRRRCSEMRIAAVCDDASVTEREWPRAGDASRCLSARCARYSLKNQRAAGKGPCSRVGCAHCPAAGTHRKTSAAKRSVARGPLVLALQGRARGVPTGTPTTTGAMARHARQAMYVRAFESEESAGQDDAPAAAHGPEGFNGYSAAAVHDAFRYARALSKRFAWTPVVAEKRRAQR
ncbi:hypothetical protein MTO96_029205 [Rhipicephalus appendiculatus]